MKQIEPGGNTIERCSPSSRKAAFLGRARLLGLTQPTVGRHIDALEEALGLALFTRSQGGLVPTESALALAPHAEAMASAAEALRRAASGEAEEDRGTVRITAGSEIIGTEVLPASLLARFREKHPRIAIELTAVQPQEDLLQREADIAIRHLPPRPRRASGQERSARLRIARFYAHQGLYSRPTALPKTH